MDQLEFCNVLKEAKRMSGKTNVDIIVALRKSQGALNDMLNGRADYTLGKYLPYIETLGFELTVQKKDESISVLSVEDAHKWMQSEVEQSTMQLNVLSEKLDITRKTLFNILKGGAIRISVFLKFVDIFGYRVILMPQL